MRKDLSPSSSPHRYAATRGATSLPRDIAFLAPHVDRRSLLDATQAARREGVSASRALIAREVISDTFYYRALADHLDCRFVDGWVLFSDRFDKLAALRRGIARLAPGEVGTWLVAPTDAAVDVLLRARARYDLRGLRIAITTPHQYSRMLRNSARNAVAHVAQDGLPDQAPHLSARHAAGFGVGLAATGGLGLCAAGALVCPHLVGDII